MMESRTTEGVLESLPMTITLVQKQIMSPNVFGFVCGCIVSTNYLLLGQCRDICITSIKDCCDGNTKELTESGTEVNVVTRELNNCGLGQQCEVFNHGLFLLWAVICDQNDECLTFAEVTDTGLEAEVELTRLCDELELCVDGITLVLCVLRVGVVVVWGWVSEWMAVVGEGGEEMGGEGVGMGCDGYFTAMVLLLKTQIGHGPP